MSTLCTFIHGTNAVYIEMRSRVSGDFRMSVTLDSPRGGLQLASGQLTVRSMSTSAVAIALSVAAGAVLLGWWGRTMWRSRRTRRGAHRQRGRRAHERRGPTARRPEDPEPGPRRRSTGVTRPVRRRPPTDPAAPPPPDERRAEARRRRPGPPRTPTQRPATRRRAPPPAHRWRRPRGRRARPASDGPPPSWPWGPRLSRLTGVIRIIALAYALGTEHPPGRRLQPGQHACPNIIHDIVLGGVLSATFIPVFVHRLTTRTDDEAWEAISAVTSVTLIVIAAASVVFLLLTPFIIDATTTLNHSAQAAQDRQVATELLLLFVPQLTCYGFISLGTALLNARRRFGAPMFSSIANNVVLIAVLLYYAITVHHAARSIGGLAHDRSQLLLLGLGHDGRRGGPGGADGARASGGPDCASPGSPTSTTRPCAPSCACRDGPSGWWWPTRSPCS